MKKLTFLVFYKEYEAFLQRLHDMGVIHIQTKEQGQIVDATLQSDVQLLGRCNATINALEMLVGKDANTVASLPSKESRVEATTLLDSYDALLAEKADVEQRLSALRKDQALLAPWGDFDPASVKRLADAGYEMNFYTCPLRAYDEEWESTCHAVVISQDKQKMNFITVTVAGDVTEIDAETCHLPEASLSDIEARIEQLEEQLAGFDGRLLAFAAENVTSLRAAREALDDNIDFARVRLAGEPVAADKLILLQGWAPEKSIEGIRANLDASGAFYEVSDPTPEDEIPIQLSNGRFARLFEPLTRLYMLPQYNELDLTLFFAPFFMLFFGLCLGDMGYGLLMIVALPIFTKLFKLINPDFSKWLVVLFGASTILCGTLSGSFFGFSLYDLNIPFVQKMKSFLFTDNSTMFTVSLCIGVVQILFGMVLKTINLTIQCGFKYAVSTIGWLVLLITVIVAMLLKVPFTNPIVLVLLCLAGIGILFFQSPGKNPLLNIGLALWDTYNMATGLLGDVLSYVRLFALGLSGGILANVFNNMAVGMSPKIPVIGFLVTVLIFCVGHALNIFMNILGAIVHPMRLTFVEFFKNAGFTGGGEAYKPFGQKAASG
jgi:V/A-type H+-transporting ATPase subunit I